MRRKSIVRVLAASFIFLLTLVSLGSKTVHAGLVVTTTDVVTKEGELNLAEWYNPNDDLSYQDGAVVFDADDNRETRLISKSVSAADKYYADMVEINATITFSAIPQDESFIVATGLSGVEAMWGEPGNVEVHFRDNGGITAEVVEYNEDGDKLVVLEEQKCGSLNAAVKVNLHITVEGELKLTVNGRVLGTVKLSHVPEGQTGFLQTGKCQARVTECTARSYAYDRPENGNVFEDFESGSLNDNCFTSALFGGARALSGLSVEELDGNKVLRFRNAGIGYFGTKQEYSNFELSFDIPYFARSYQYDEYGTVIEAPSGEFGVSFGDFAADVSGQDYTQSTDLLLFTGSVHGWFSGWREPYTDKNLFDENTNEGFSVRIRVVDGRMTVWMKPLKTENWMEIATHTYDNFKTGYIKIWSTRDTNLAIDNFKVENLDQDPNLKEYEFKSAKIVQEDFAYEPTELVFREEAETEEKSFPWMVIVLGAAALGVVILGGGITANLIIRKKSKKKEVQA